MLVFGKLPSDILKYILEFVPIDVKLWMTKENYSKYHPCIKDLIRREDYENYIRDMVRRDNDFVFSFLLRENFNKWLSFKKYHYKSTIYSNYIYFLLGLCVDSESPKCRELIRAKLTETGLSKNQHKKNSTTSIRWRT